jgi:hypothetical protein
LRDYSTNHELRACYTHPPGTIVSATKKKVHSLWGIQFIVLEKGLGVEEDQWYSQEVLPNGDIILRKQETELDQKRLVKAF